MHDRYLNILQSRLKTEIENRLPLFPWETEIIDYPDVLPEEMVPVSRARLSIPGDIAAMLPEAIFAQLFDRAQEVVQLSIQRGAKLVRALESLFPDATQTLNELVGTALIQETVRDRDSNLADRLGVSAATYAEASEQEQMAIAFLVARELVDALTVELSPTAPTAQRHLPVAAGIAEIEMEYQSQGILSRLLVRAQLPEAGRIELVGGDARAQAQRSDAGYLGVELYDPQRSQSYCLNLSLAQTERSPITLAIHLAE